MSDIPEYVPWGTIVCRIGDVLSDGEDEGSTPDVRFATGMVTLTPSVQWVKFFGSDPTLLARVAVLECPVIGGDLYPPGTTSDALPPSPGVPVIASLQPQGEPNLIAWTASFDIDDIDQEDQPPPITFNVRADRDNDLAQQGTPLV